LLPFGIPRRAGLKWRWQANAGLLYRTLEKLKSVLDQSPTETSSLRLFYSYCLARKVGSFVDHMRDANSIWYRGLFALALMIFLGSCAEYGPFHANTASQPLNSVRGPSDGRYKFALMEFGDHDSALDMSQLAAFSGTLLSGR